MFTLTRDVSGVICPVALLFIAETLTPQSFPAMIVTAASARDSLDLFGVSGVVQFTDAQTQVTLTAPWQGTDFLTARTGTLTVRITEALPVGMHLAAMIGCERWPGVCGYGGFGLGVGGYQNTLRSDAAITLQIQALPEDWRTDAQQTAQPYVVSAVTRLTV